MAISERLALLVSLDAKGAVKSFNDLGSAADKNLSKADTRLDKMSSRFQKAGAGMLATAGLAGAALYKAGQAASDLGEELSQSGQIFGKASGSIEDFAKGAASSLGQSERAAAAAANTFGLFFTNAGKSSDEAAKMSIELTQLASDMASFKNTSPEDAVAALGAALRGESEPIRRYGVMLDDATLKQRALSMGLIQTTTGTLPPAIKQQAAYAEILEQTSTIQGDFARTSDGLANQQRILNAEFENAKAALGKSLAPVLADVVGGLADMAGGFTSADEASNGFLSKAVAVGTVTLGAAGGLSFMAGKVIDARDRFKEISAATSGFRDKVSNLSPAVKGLGLAFAFASIAAVAFAEDQKKVSEGAKNIRDEAASTGQSLHDAFVKQVSDAVTENESLRKSLDAAGVSFADVAAALTGTDEEFGNFQRNLIDSVPDTAIGKLTQLRAQYEEAGNQASEAGTHVSELAAAHDTAATSVEGMATQIDGATEGVDAEKEALDRATESTKLFKDGLDAAFGDLTIEEATDRRAQAFADLAGDIQDRAEAVANARQRLADAEAGRSDNLVADSRAIADAEERLAEARSRTASTDDERESRARAIADAEKDLARVRADAGDGGAAERAITDAQRELQAAIADTSLSLDGNSESARRNREDIRSAVENVADLIEKHREEGDSLAELQGIRYLERENLRKQLEQLGFNRDEIARYIDAIDKIPITKATTITADTAPAQLRIKELADSLVALAPDQKFSIDAAVIDRNLQRAQTRRAIGGPVTAGERYSTNEYLGAGKGYEWFAPANGTVKPAGATAGTNSYDYAITIVNPVPEPASTSLRRLRQVSLEVASR